MKIQNALVSNIFNRSQRYFAHVRTVTLSWRVQNIVVIGRVYFTLECFECSSNFEFDRIMLSGTGARALENSLSESPGQCLQKGPAVMVGLFCSILSNYNLFNDILMWGSHATYTDVSLSCFQGEGYWIKGEGWWHQMVDILGRVLHIRTTGVLHWHLPLLDSPLLVLQGRLGGENERSHAQEAIGAHYDVVNFLWNIPNRHDLTIYWRVAVAQSKAWWASDCQSHYLI